jgi:hypothetical protein
LKKREEAMKVAAGADLSKATDVDEAGDSNVVDGTMGDDPDVDSLAKVPEGTLYIQIVQALDVMAADHNGLSDPFCICFFEDKVGTPPTRPPARLGFLQLSGSLI